LSTSGTPVIRGGGLTLVIVNVAGCPWRSVVVTWALTRMDGSSGVAPDMGVRWPASTTTLNFRSVAGDDHPFVGNQTTSPDPPALASPTSRGPWVSLRASARGTSQPTQTS